MILSAQSFKRVAPLLA